MNLDNIKCFISLAECLNFTRAADKEHITQTSMSRKIRNLETELGIVLFYRDNHQVELTEAGREFYIQSLKMMELYDRSVSMAQNIQNGYMRELKIGVGIYEHKLLSPFLGLYAALHPTLKISCMQYRYHSLLKRFEQEQMDLIFTSDQFFSELPKENLDMHLIHDGDWKMGVHKNNPLAAYDAVPSDLLTGATLITMHEGSTSQIFDHYRPYFTFRDIIYVNSYETKVMMINANLGVGMMPSFMTLDHYDGICMKPIDKPYRPRRFYILCRRDHPSHFVHEFYQSYCNFADDGFEGELS